MIHRRTTLTTPTPRPRPTGTSEIKPTRRTTELPQTNTSLCRRTIEPIKHYLERNSLIKASLFFKDYLGLNKRSCYAGMLVLTNISIGATLIFGDKFFARYLEEFNSNESTDDSKRQALSWFIGSTFFNAALYATNAIVSRLFRSWLMLDYRKDLFNLWLNCNAFHASKLSKDDKHLSENSPAEPILPSRIITDEIENAAYYWIESCNDLSLKTILGLASSYQLFQYSSTFFLLGLPIPSLLLAVAGYAFCYKIINIIPNNCLESAIDKKNAELASMRNYFEEIDFKSRSLSFQSDRKLILKRFEKNQQTFSEIDSKKLLPQLNLSFTRTLSPELSMALGPSLIASTEILNIALLGKHIKNIIEWLSWMNSNAKDLKRLDHSINQLNRLTEQAKQCGTLFGNTQEIHQQAWRATQLIKGNQLSFKGEIHLPNPNSPTELGRSLSGAINITLQPGERVKLSGPNGAGKTTLMESIYDVHPYYTGTITKPKNVAYLPQTALIWDNEPLLRSMNHGDESEATRIKIEGLMRKLNLEKFIDRLDENNLWSKKLSGGEKQLIAIVKLLCINPAPELILLDEPFSALSEGSVQLVVKALNEHFPKAGMLFIDHEKAPDNFHTRTIKLSKAAEEPESKE